MNKTIFTPGEDKKSMVIERELNASLEQVWQAWTKQELLEKWWAPEPWKAVTKEFDFSEGGRWLYAMTGPEGEQHWSLEEYSNIKPLTSFTANDYFCDEQGNPNLEMPSNQWHVSFHSENGKTRMSVLMVVKEPKDLETLTKMGFKEGFSQGLNQLEDLLSNN